MAVLGVLARPSQDRHPPSRRRARTAAGRSPASRSSSLIVGVISVAHASSDDMDAAAQAGRSREQARPCWSAPSSVHPARLLLRAVVRAARADQGRAEGDRLPRLHALNRALQLCPSCEAVHAEVASNLWRLGFRAQALLEWRAAVDLQPVLLNSVLGKLFAAGAKPEELAAVAASDAGRMVEVANFLSSIARVADAFVVLDQADAHREAGAGELARSRQAPAAVGTDRRRAEDHRGRARGRHPGRAAVAARGEGPARGQGRSGRPTRRCASWTRRRRATRLISRWRASASSWCWLPRSGRRPSAPWRASSGRSTSRRAARPRRTSLNARIQARLGRLTAALGEYRVALADQPGSVSLWMEFGRAAENGGRDTVAREAYREAARLSPDSPEVAEAVHRLDERSAASCSLRRSVETWPGLKSPPANGP